jgi:hypothetical protein
MELNCQSNALATLPWGKGSLIPLNGSESRAGFLERVKNFLFLVDSELRISQPVA